jgi:hypothetical protein
MSIPSPLVLIISGLSIVPFLLGWSEKIYFDLRSVMIYFSTENTVNEPYHVPASDPSGFIRHLFILQLITSTDSQ